MPTSPPKWTGVSVKSVLFVCTGNAGRSQIAEELFRRLAPAGTAVASAGVEPWRHVHAMAAALLSERGIDIHAKKPRHVRDRTSERFELIVTIGAPARDRTPEWPGHPIRIHWDIADPADADGTTESMSAFRRALAEIERRLPALVDLMQTGAPDVPPFSAGISTCIVRPEPFMPARHLPLIAQAGFRSIELNCFQGEKDFDWRAAGAIRELVRVANGEGVCLRSVHAFGESSPGFDETHRREYLDTNRTYCQMAVELGARVVVIHSLKPRRDVPPDWNMRMRELLDEMARDVLPLPLLLGVENVNWLVDPAEDMELIRSQSPAAIGFVLDTGHADLFNANDQYLSLCGLRLCGLHLQDTDGQYDRHWLPGRGRFDWKWFMSRLVQTGYTGPLTLEVEERERQIDLPTRLDECMRSVRMLQLLLPTESNQNEKIKPCR